MPESVPELHVPALEAIREDLDAITERLDDVIFEILRDAAAAGERERPALERRLTRAVHALQRASSLVQGQLERDLDEDEGP